MRIDDLDQPRVVNGSAAEIIATLAAYGFEWDGEITYQSRQRHHYAAAIQLLREHEKIYVCTCSRAQIALQNSQATEHHETRTNQESEEPRYSGSCRPLARSPMEAHSLRFRADASSVKFADSVQGPFEQNVAKTCGDFVVQRRDGIHAYHLAVVQDDHESGITEVVRGADLLGSTPRQILLQRALGLATPDYCHLPIAVDSSGAKLSKSAQSIPISGTNAQLVLWQALQFLRQSPPLQLRTASLNDIWNWSIEHWNLAPLIGVSQGLAPSELLNY